MGRHQCLVCVALAVVSLAACETTKVAGLGESCGGPPCCTLVNVVCGPGLICSDRDECEAATPTYDPSLSSYAEPDAGGEGGADGETAASPGSDASSADAGCDASNACVPGAVETTSAGCPAGVYRHRECREDCTWTHFSTTCE